MSADLVRAHGCDLTRRGQDILVGFLATGYDSWATYLAWAERPENHAAHLQRVECARTAILAGLTFLERLPPR